ncbi:hypothetical protein [Kribbella sp. CA-293567]|uniref:hypothetical protein n=1 Tax=Kribbella sp. CA-293567 TaxID=3002436 RepID=UPI0022DDE34B|nr:hypothetical protein [Kribbella sp. CA-293567]WBQ04704.1 hypothetical protein OX958_32670 [Kribbella sp. CA-293567]
MTMTYAQPITRRARKHAVPALWRQVVRGAAPAEPVVEPQQDRSAFTQLEIYDGVLAAFDRRTEVLRTIKGSSDRLTAAFRIRRLLGVSQLQATAILELQEQGLSTAARNRVAQRAGELRAALGR